MAKQRLAVIVLGDSLMWGQGLREEDKFTTQAVQQIGALLQREAVIVSNMAHSGASTRGGHTQDEMQQAREKFVDTYPSLFNASNVEEDFIKHNNQVLAQLLHGEVPRTFPTVSYQVESVPEAFARGTELVFLDGGINDLGFEDYLNPKKHSDDFAEYYAPLFEEYFYLRTKSLMLQARERFPKAVFILIGYYAPFAPGVSHYETKDLFEYLGNVPEWQDVFDQSLLPYGFGEIDELVEKTHYRARYGLARALYWQRKAVVEANEDPRFRGPGILFIHPQFGPENTVFAPHSFLHREYIPAKVKDSMKKIREESYSRISQESDLEALYNMLLFALRNDPHSSDSVSRHGADIKSLIVKILGELDGPTSLLVDLNNLKEVDLDNLKDGIPRRLSQVPQRVREGLEAELHRITTIHRASFMHPNEKGAQRYTNVIVKRYTERHHHIRLREDLLKLQQRDRGTKPAGLKRALRRYGLGSQTSLREITQMMLVDSIALQIVTEIATDSAFVPFAPRLTLLSLGGTNQWQFSPFDPGLGPPSLLTLDAQGTHLSSITQFMLAGVLPNLFKITLHINGKEVFSTPFSEGLATEVKLTFPYPAPEE